MQIVIKFLDFSLTSLHFTGFITKVFVKPLRTHLNPPQSHWFTEGLTSIRSLPRLGTAFAARIETVLYP